MATCNVQTLINDGSCFQCLDADLGSAVELQLLYQWSGSTSSVQELITAGACFQCVGPENEDIIELQLLCNRSG